MKTKWFRICPGFLLLLSILVGFIAACGGATEEISLTEEPTESPGDSIEGTLAEIDAQLRNTMRGNIAHSAPSSMHVEETAEISLLISPSLSPDDLETRITESGVVITDVINITPWMRAELISPNQDAFSIAALHGDAQQPLSTVEPTEWKWLITAEEGGDQKLILVISRLVEVEDRESWRLVEEYRYPIDVDVSVEARLRNLVTGLWDIKWWIGGIVFPIVVYFILKRLD